MKKFLAIAIVAATFAACNDNTNAVESTKDSVTVTPVPDAPPVDTITAPVDTATVK